jgi:hypothetical protein
MWDPVKEVESVGDFRDAHSVPSTLRSMAAIGVRKNKRATPWFESSPPSTQTLI